MNTRPGLFARQFLGVAFLTYLVGTVLLFFWGPWYYPVGQGKGRLIAFLVAVHVAFAAGYLIGTRGRPRSATIRVPVEKLVLASVAIQLALLFPTSHLYTGNWIPNPWAAADDFGGAYAETLARRQSITPYVNYLRILISPLLALAIPLGVFYWRSFSVITKALFVSSVVGTLTLYIAMATNVAAGDWMALFPWFVIAGHFSGVQRLDRKGWAKAAAIQLMSVALFAFLFSAAMVQRTGSFAKWGSIGRIAKLKQPPPAPAASRGKAPPKTAAAARPAQASRTAAQIGAQGLAGYVTQGYYAVYLSLHEPFVPCYGVGNSVFVQRQVARITGNDTVLTCSYPVRIQRHGWSAMGNWPTIYPWIASDVTFPGTVVIVFLVGWLSARVWLDVLGGQNPFAVALLGQLLLMLYFFPAHNRIMQSGEGVVALLVFLLAWLFLRQPKVAVN